VYGHWLVECRHREMGSVGGNAIEGL
jgi:hypothetical protein